MPTRTAFCCNTRRDTFVVEPVNRMVLTILMSLICYLRPQTQHCQHMMKFIFCSTKHTSKKGTATNSTTRFGFIFGVSATRSSNDPVSSSTRLACEEAHPYGSREPSNAGSSTSSPTDGIIVEFPKQRRRSSTPVIDTQRSSASEKSSLSFGDLIFGSLSGELSPLGDFRTDKSKDKQQPHASPKNHQGRSSPTQFQYTIDWKNSPIDWGDDGDDECGDEQAIGLGKCFKPEPSLV